MNCSLDLTLSAFIVPLFEDNRGIINKQTINRMKDGVMIINTSPGPLIVEQDL